MIFKDKESVLALLRSDLRDTQDPKILKKYPHLADPILRKELLEKIKSVEEAKFDGSAYVTEIAPRCMDCGLDYETGFALDTLLTKDQWLMIHPEENGLLCANCIVNRAGKLPGVLSISAKIEFAKDPIEGLPNGWEELRESITQGHCRCSVGMDYIHVLQECPVHGKMGLALMESLGGRL